MALRTGTEPCGPIRRFRLPALIAALLPLLSAPVRAADYAAAMVADVTTGHVLFSQASEQPRYPASLTKMMTLYVLFEDLERRRCSLDTPLLISDYASAQSPTKLGLRSGESIRVEEAIRALVTHSANDVAVAIAENLEGSEPAFAARMTRTAQALGMSGTQFRNASGLTHPEQFSTARDMLVLGTALQSHFPRYFAYFSTDSFTFRGRSYRNHNKLLGRVEGVNGIKTGYTRASGFNLVTSIRRNGRAYVAVVMGWPTAKSRDEQMEALIGSYVPGGAAANTAVAASPKATERVESRKQTQTAASNRPASPAGPPKTRAASAVAP